MKITGIDIGEYRQFKNIKFDFTYPEGHPKAGQPLEKVCFIGQSGTGKTTLLRIIEEYFKAIDFGLDRQKYIDNKLKNNENRHRDDTGMMFYNYILNIRIKALFNDRYIEFDRYNNAYTTERGDDILRWINNEELLELATLRNPICLFITESIAREANAFLFDQKDQQNVFSDFIKTDTQIEEERVARESRLNKVGSRKVISLGDMQSLSTWQYLLRDIDKYDEETVKYITNIVQNTPKEKVTEELQRWIDADPRIELAQKCLNPILSKFILEVDDSEKGKVPIAIRTKGGIKIDSSYLSTGTRQILATAIPIYKFDTKDTVILFDEPERSLFPDIQRELVKYYTNLAPEAQFFFATHSPIIASAFEPCERFILYFDENGEVKRRNGVAPIGDDPNDILSADFGMNELMLQPGLDAYERYRNLFVEIKNEKDPMRQKELIVEQAKLGDQYNF
ncbi:ATP-binding protein [Spirosoma panaciterrae]|uniref:ATP-binding protein n=1 Tax=Spirosoma panaciterrae TaxID=496058 RepID=UPI00035DAA01|nr:ATP-binding protein [Spirosoma panaciterrae]